MQIQYFLWVGEGHSFNTVL